MAPAKRISVNAAVDSLPGVDGSCTLKWRWPRDDLQWSASFPTDFAKSFCEVAYHIAANLKLLRNN